HGESLGDHGEETHAMFVYEAAIKVPFVVWGPGILPARVVQEPVRGIDLSPTLLDLLGAPPLPEVQGRSLLPLIEGREKGKAPAAYVETLLPQLYMGWAPLRAIRDDRYKLIEAPRPELYDLQADPGERNNIYKDRPQTVQALSRALEDLKGGE